jgi:hypothetical protein
MKTIYATNWVASDGRESELIPPTFISGIKSSSSDHLQWVRVLHEQ